MPPGGAQQVYRDAISELARHCSSQGLIAADEVGKCPVTVQGIPDYMRPVRSNAAYSMPPIHPPRGGTFFILETGQGASIPADYRLLTAHETYPGHHLLDTSRWRHTRPIRRHIEFPIFYEGWASFAEELMFETGFFSGPVDRMLMAKRRFWRAVRGQIDFDIHMRRRTLDEAAAFLAEQGMDPGRATAMVRRYSLKPGYQLAYTMGRRRFRRLYDDSCRKGIDPVAFARRVLAQGEIRFSSFSADTAARRLSVSSFSGYHSEWNLGSPGGWDYQRMTQEIAKVVWQKINRVGPTGVDLDFDHPLLYPVVGFAEMLLAVHRQREGANPGLLAVVAEEETLADVTENINLARRLDAVDGITGILAAPHEFELKHGRVCHQGRPVSLIFMDFNNDVFLKLHRKHDLTPLYQAIRENRILNPRGTEPINVKSMFEVITGSQSAHFHPETVRRTPWTRRFFSSPNHRPQGRNHRGSGRMDAGKLVSPRAQTRARLFRHRCEGRRDQSGWRRCH